MAGWDSIADGYVVGDGGTGDSGACDNGAGDGGACESDRSVLEGNHVVSVYSRSCWTMRYYSQQAADLGPTTTAALLLARMASEKVLARFRWRGPTAQQLKLWEAG
jgi:hypothetical protein